MKATRLGWYLIAMFAALMFGLSWALSGCLMYQPANMEEWIAQAKQLDGNGCVYLRGNARPAADVSVLAIHAYGKNAPKYKECLEAIPPDARTLAP